MILNNQIIQQPKILRKNKRKNNLHNYKNKKFKEDSVQPPNIRGEIEQKITVEKASKINKISYTFGMEDKLIRNKIDNFDTNGNALKLL